MSHSNFLVSKAVIGSAICLLGLAGAMSINYSDEAFAGDVPNKSLLLGQKTSNFVLISTPLIAQFNDPSLGSNSSQNSWYCSGTNRNYMYFRRHQFSPDVHVSYNPANPAETHVTMGQYNRRQGREIRFYYYPLGNGGNGSFNESARRSSDVQRALMTVWINFRNSVLSPNSVPPPSICRNGRHREL